MAPRNRLFFNRSRSRSHSVTLIRCTFPTRIDKATILANPTLLLSRIRSSRRSSNGVDGCAEVMAEAERSAESRNAAGLGREQQAGLVADQELALAALQTAPADPTVAGTSVQSSGLPTEQCQLAPVVHGDLSQAIAAVVADPR